MDTQRQQRRTLVAAAVLLPLVAACGGERAGAGRGSGSAEAARPLTGVRWTVALPEAGGRAHLTFDGKGTVSGSLGCNDVGAGATVRDGHITLGAPATTRMMCEDSLMDAERTLLRLFGGTVAYRIDSGNLTLTSENGTRVTAFAAE